MKALRVRLTVGHFFTYAHGEVVFHPAGTVLSVTSEEFARLVEAGAAVPVTDEMAVEQR